MNSCIIMGEIVKAPELRYTQEGQMAIAEMTVQIEPLRANDPASTLKVVAWGNLGQQVQEQCHAGDTVILEGRLNMNTLDRPEGYKEKVAELTVSRIHPVNGSSMSLSGGPSNAMGNTQMPTPPPQPMNQGSAPAPMGNPPAVEPNFDDIPF